MIEVVIQRKNGRQRKPEVRGNRPSREGEQGVDVVDGGEALSLRYISNVLLQGLSLERPRTQNTAHFLLVLQRLCFASILTNKFRIVPCRVLREACF